VLAGRSGNRIGAHLLTTGGVLTVPARSGHPHVMALLHRLLVAPRGDGAAPPPAAGLDLVARAGARRGLAVVIGDFAGDAGWQPALARVAARHEVLAVEVVDPRELDLPDVGLLVVVDPETGEEREVRTGDARLRTRYAALARSRRASTAAALAAAGADHVILRTDRDATADLVRWLALRPARVAHRRRARAGAEAAGGRWR